MYLFFLIAFCVMAYGADFDAAKRAYEASDYVSAAKELAPLVEHGDPAAQALLGRMYLMGQGFAKDPDRAANLFEAAAKQGHAEAQFFLGSMLLLPRKNVVEGLKWIRLAADQGNQDAQLLLGKAYVNGSPELPRDPVQGEMWLQLAARNNLEFYRTQLSAAEKTMSADDIAKGKALAEAWKPKRARE
jgi:TPR repeat protein